MINDDLNLLDGWLGVNHLRLNVEKTKYLIFGNSTWVDGYQVLYNNKIIEKVFNYCYLGLVIDFKLNWHEHINSIKKSISPYVFVIKRMRNIVERKYLMLIFNSYVHSRLLYLNPIWSGAPQCRMDELEIIRKRALKFIKGVHVRFPTVELFDEFSSLQIICIRELLIIIYKIINNLIVHNLIITRSGEHYEYNLRNAALYSRDYFNKNLSSRNNLLYRGIPLFNKLPDKIQSSPTLKFFKEQMKIFVDLNKNLFIYNLNQ